jgi:hypothetical protein
LHIIQPCHYGLMHSVIWWPKVFRLVSICCWKSCCIVRNVSLICCPYASKWEWNPDCICWNWVFIVCCILEK